MFQFQFDSKKVTWSFSGYEYWIGLNQMFSLTNQNKMFQLRVTMKKFNQTMRIETYNSFKILDNVIFSLCMHLSCLGQIIWFYGSVHTLALVGFTASVSLIGVLNFI